MKHHQPLEWLLVKMALAASNTKHQVPHQALATRILESHAHIQLELLQSACVVLVANLPQNLTEDVKSSFKSACIWNFSHLQQTDLDGQTSRTNRILLTEWSAKGPFFSLDLCRPPCPQWCVHSRKSRTNRLNRMMLTKSVRVSSVTVWSGRFSLGSHRDQTKETEHDPSSQIFSP